MLLTCYLSHRGIVSPRHDIFCIFVSTSMPWSIYVLFMQLFYSILLFIIIFIFIIVNYIISLTQKSLFFGHACQKVSLRALLSFCLFFCKFQPGVAYKSVAYKKSVYLVFLNQICYNLYIFICHVSFTSS